MLTNDLAALSEAATQGEWKHRQLRSPNGAFLLADRIEALTSQLAEATEREAQAKLDGVRAGETYATKGDSDGDDGA
jgi:hypothetical protein